MIFKWQPSTKSKWMFETRALRAPWKTQGAPVQRCPASLQARRYSKAGGTKRTPHFRFAAWEIPRANFYRAPIQKKRDGKRRAQDYHQRRMENVPNRRI